MSSLPQQLQELAVLRQNGTISEEEYIASKAAILGKNPAPVQVANVTPVIQQDLKVLNIVAKNFSPVRMSDLWLQNHTLLKSHPENIQVKESMNT